jgi:hypothetical protein
MQMKKPLDLIGQTYGRLTPIEIHGKSSTGKIIWLCRCDCGAEKLAATPSLRSGKVGSCGCLRREMMSDSHRKHGECPRNGLITAEYRTWQAMKRRCDNERQPGWKNYGGRGIVVCERWNNSFDDFLADMGRKPTPQHSIERVDNNAGYFPDNCIWATRSEQNSNTRISKKNRIAI